MLTRHARTLALGALALLIATVAVPAGATTGTPGGGFFHTVCGYSHTLPDDPIVHPMMSGMSHMHDFGGNATTNASSTLMSLQMGASNCSVHAPDQHADRSGYWVPQLYFNGFPVPFLQQQAYYQSKIGPVSTPPAGTELIGGNAKATAPLPTQIVKFTCSGDAGKLIGARTAPPVCPDGSMLKVVVQTPNCLDHAVVVSPDYVNDTPRSAYADQAGHCPPGYDPIVQARVEVKYPPGVDGRGLITLSSGPYYTMHADWFNAWDHRTLDRFVQLCVNTGTDCGDTMP